MVASNMSWAKAFILTTVMTCWLSPSQASWGSAARASDTPVQQLTVRPMLPPKSPTPNELAAVAAMQANQHKPLPSATEVLVWANEAAVAAYSYDHANLRQFLQQAQRYFSPEGWQQFMSPKRKLLLQQEVSEHAVVSAVATGAPLIMAERQLKQGYNWMVQIPMLTTRYQMDKTQKQEWVMTLQIQYQDSNMPGGLRHLAIQQIAANPTGQQRSHL